MASFGFSIGDFLAIGDIARRIAEGLSESRGATAEYKSLCELLLSFNRALYAASAVFFYSPVASSTAPRPDQASLNGMRYEMECCKQLMNKFLDSSKKYTESLLNGRPWWRFKDEWRKITWTLYRADDVRKLHTNLQGHIGAFQLYTFAITWQGIARTEQKAIEGAEASRRVELRVSEMFTLLKTLQENLPKTIGYPWEGGCTKYQKPIHLEDALGRAVTLPIMLCKSKNDFHDLLQIMFKGLPGQKRVAQSDYEIISASGGLIKDCDWESNVLPGVHIAMSILIRTRGTKSITAQTCPRCQKSNIGATLEKGFITCCFCQLTFRISDTDRIVELPQKEQDNLYSSQDLGTRAVGSLVEKVAPREEDAFRRIHYHQEKLEYVPGPLPRISGPWPNWNSSNSRTPQGRQRLSMVIDAAVQRSAQVGNADMGLSIRRLYNESLSNAVLADLLDNVLAQVATAEQIHQFQAYVRATRSGAELSE